MTIYNVNLGIGWASSGVEYAQYYRSQIFEYLKLDARFIFTDMIKHETLQHLTANLGLRDDQIIWLYQYFSDIPIQATTVALEDVLDQFPEPPSRIVKEESVQKCFFGEPGQENFYLTCYMKAPDQNLVERVEYVSRGCLIRKDYYTSCRLFTEYYVPRDNQACLFQRRFYNQDGSICLDEIIDGDNVVYRLPDQIFYSKETFLKYFFDCLNFSEDDVILIDRSTGTGQAILNSRGKARVGCIVHADHYSNNYSDDRYILWNNYYEFEFHYARDIDFFICATQAQTDLLRRQFRHYCGFAPEIRTIPVGCLNELRRPEGDRKPYSLITASRLASEKHVDWLVEAVSMAKKSLPDLSFDIYGTGGEENLIRQRIKELGATDYIRLKGHQLLDDVYKNYQLYISASTSEGFGLSLLEAIGSGLPIVGFDVPYGNPTFIEPGKSGFLVDWSEDAKHSDLIQALADAIVQCYKQDINSLTLGAYEKAEEFTLEAVAAKWQELLQDFRPIHPEREEKDLLAQGSGSEGAVLLPAPESSDLLKDLPGIRASVLGNPIRYEREATSHA